MDPWLTKLDGASEFVSVDPLPTDDVGGRTIRSPGPEVILLVDSAILVVMDSSSFTAAVRWRVGV